MPASEFVTVIVAGGDVLKYYRITSFLPWLTKRIFMPHIARHVKNLLRTSFGDACVVRCHFRHVCRPRYPYLTPCDCWLWCNLNPQVYHANAAQRQLLIINTAMLYSAVHNAILQPLLLRNDGGHVENLFWRKSSLLCHDLLCWLLLLLWYKRHLLIIFWIFFVLTVKPQVNWDYLFWRRGMKIALLSLV